MPDDPNTFRYHDGAALAWGDPFRIDRLLTRLCNGDVQTVLDRLDNPDPAIALPAWDQFLDAIGKAFPMQPLGLDPRTGRGVSEAAYLAAFDAFVTYQEDLKKNSAPTPTCSPATAPAS